MGLLLLLLLLLLYFFIYSRHDDLTHFSQGRTTVDISVLANLEEDILYFSKETLVGHFYSTFYFGDKLQECALKDFVRKNIHCAKGMRKNIKKKKEKKRHILSTNQHVYYYFFFFFFLLFFYRYL